MDFQSIKKNSVVKPYNLAGKKDNSLLYLINYHPLGEPEAFMPYRQRLQRLYY